MQGDAEIIEVLNEILTAELTAINQYFIHAKMRENWGFLRLAAVARKESIEEMEDADKIIERILYLDGVPNLQRYNPVLVGETVLVAAHGNSLRAIVKLLYALSSEAIIDVEIPTGNPLLIELDGALKPISARYLDEARATRLPTYGL